MFFGGIINAVRRKIQSNEELENVPPFSAQKKKRQSGQSQIQTHSSSAKTECPKSENEQYRIAVKDQPENGRRLSTFTAKEKRYVSTLERIERLKERFYLDATDNECEALEGTSAENCCVCLTRLASVRIYPCGHQVVCRLCAITLIQSLLECGQEDMHCIVCRANIVALRHQKTGGNKRDPKRCAPPTTTMPIRHWRHCLRKRQFNE